MKKPIILITIGRRYSELIKCLINIENLAHEFSIKPDIILVWSCPQVMRLWFFKKLEESGKIKKILYRYDSGDDFHGPTSYFVALNIWVGLDYIKENYNPEEHYIICQDCDIFPNPNVYSLIDKEIQDHEAVLFHWQNSCSNHNAWCTNFFAVGFNCDYWPPKAEISADTYEAQYGRKLLDKNLGNFFKSHNSRNQKFLHSHETVDFNLFPSKPQLFDLSVPLCVTGYNSLLSKFRNLMKRILWLK